MSIYYQTLHTFNISQKTTSMTTHLNSEIFKYSKENMNTRVVYIYFIFHCDYMMIKGVIWYEWDHTKTNMVVVFMSFCAKRDPWKHRKCNWIYHSYLRLKQLRIKTRGWLWAVYIYFFHHANWMNWQKKPSTRQLQCSSILVSRNSKI